MASAPQATITTILFTDLVNSTEVIQRLGDERAREAFAAHHARLAELVAGHGGRELQWLGDGLMAAFPSTGDAVRCSVAMQRAARQPVAGERLEMRAGLNVGEILEQEGGSGYFGTPVVVASRLCDRASPGQILASQLVAGLLAGRHAFRFRDLGTASLKGIEATVAIAEVVYEAEGTAPFAGSGPFVGRRHELARLEQALERAAAGTGGVAMVVGEPGIGKTRTLAQLAASARGRGVTVLFGRCFEGEGQVPYAPFAEALEEYLQSADPDDVRKELGRRGAALHRIVPRLADMIPDLPELPKLQPDEERARLFDSVTQLLLRAAGRSPLLLVLDDLHWADTGTVGLLRHVARFVAKGRLLLVGAYRDVELDRAHPLADALGALRREVEHDRIRLRGLERTQVGELLETLAAHPVPEALVEALSRETEGNPLFLREIQLHQIEEGRIFQEDGRWTSDLPVEGLGSPEGVRQVLGRRLSRLSEPANRLLAAASGFSGAFRFDVAAAASGLEEMPALDALDEALEAQLLLPTGEADAYDFSHALIRHTLYAELNPSRQVRLHRRLAEALEQRYAGDEHAAEIARQYHRSAALPGAERGVGPCLAAADRAEAAAAHGEAAAFLKMALELLPAADAARPRLEARLALDLAWDVKLEEAVAVASRAGAAIAATEGDAAAADYLAEATHAVWGVGLSPLAWRLAEQGMRHVGDRRDLTFVLLRDVDIVRREAVDPELLGIPLDSPERRELSDAAKRLPVATRDWAVSSPGAFGLIYDSREEILKAGAIDGYTKFQAGLYRESFEDLRRSSREALNDGRLAAACVLRVLEARYELSFGRLADSERSLGEAVEIAGRIPPSQLLATQIFYGWIERAFVLGQGSEAFTPGTLALIEQSPDVNQWLMATAKSLAATLCAYAGREDEALRWLSRALPAIDRAPGWAVNYPLMVSLAVRTLWELGRSDHLETIERNLREKVVEPDFRYILTDGRLALAQLCVLTGRFDEAQQWFERARAVLDEEDSRPLRAIVDCIEAESIARRGMPAASGRLESLLASARERFREIGMPGWTRRAEALPREPA